MQTAINWILAWCYVEGASAVYSAGWGHVGTAMEWLMASNHVQEDHTWSTIPYQQLLQCCSQICCQLPQEAVYHHLHWHQKLLQLKVAKSAYAPALAHNRCGAACKSSRGCLWLLHEYACTHDMHVATNVSGSADYELYVCSFLSYPYMPMCRWLAARCWPCLASCTPC